MAASLRAAWEPLAGFFEGLWTRITGIFTAAWARISPIFEAIRAFMARIFGGGSSPTGPVNEPAAQAQRRANQRGRGVQPIEGFNDPIQPQSAPASPLSGNAPLASPLAAAPGAGLVPQLGQVEVNINLANAPIGTRVEASSSGGLVAAPTTNVGYAMGRAPA